MNATDVDRTSTQASAEREAEAEAALKQARELRADGDRAQAAEHLEQALRGRGLWRYARLWSELRSTMTSPADYARIHALWMESPYVCHNNVFVLNAVARAASVAGEHAQARLLVRKATLLHAVRSRRMRSRLRHFKQETTARAKRLRPTPDAGDFEAKAAEALSELNAELDSLNVRGFLISGTLLGLERDGGFISWDKDLDLGFFTSEVSSAALEEHFEKLRNFHVRRLDFNTDRLRINHVNGAMIDVFPHYEEDGRIWHDGTATRWQNSPFALKQVEFLGRPQYVPDPPSQYLDENYGDWRRPEPNFDARLDAPNAEVTDQDFLDTLLYFALYDAARKRSQTKLARYKKLLRRLGEGAWLDRVR